MLRKLLVILTGLLILFLSSCEEKMGIMDQPETFGIQPVSVPARISVSKVKTYSISFTVTHPEGVNAIDSVWVTFFGSNQSTGLDTIGLHDDGSIDHPGDGDVIAGDGVFTNTFQSDSTIFPLGDVFIRATALDKNQQQRQTDFISSLSILNAPPVLVSTSVPDTLPSGSPPVLFSVTVQDSNDVDDVDEVILKLKRQNLTAFSTDLNLISSSIADTAMFGAFFDSSFAAERIGDYELEFQAVDLSGDSSNVLTQSIYLENGAPSLSNIDMPDSLKRPSSGSVLAFVTIQCVDPQGLSDIDSVYFYSLKPDSTLANMGAPLLMRDNGLPFNPQNPFVETGDLAANDGIFSLTIGLNSSALIGRYVFSFFARDRVGNFTVGPVDSIIVFQ